MRYNKRFITPSGVEHVLQRGRLVIAHYKDSYGNTYEFVWRSSLLKFGRENSEYVFHLEARH